MTRQPPYRPIEDYAFLSDCFSAALVSREGSVDWLCMPRLDSPSYFGRLLDPEIGGHCSLAPQQAPTDIHRRYLDQSFVLETCFDTATGTARVYDLLVLREGGREHPPHRMLRIVEGIEGSVDFRFECAPRFDYGQLTPWIRSQGPGRHAALGGDDGLLIDADVGLACNDHCLTTDFSIEAGQRVRFCLMFVPPERLDCEPPTRPEPPACDDDLEHTLSHWHAWAQRARDVPDASVLRSALVLRGLIHAPTGAIAAAATTSLPEVPGGSLNWDYRYCWVRDSFYSVRALAEVGFTGEADGYRRFIQRTSAGRAEEMRILFGLGGERNMVENEVDLAGYKGAAPVRVGNAAADQLQLDMYGQVLELTWLWYLRGPTPTDDFWRFLVELVDTASERWHERDHGFWEVRDRARHFVRSKSMCWLALDRGLRLAEGTGRNAPVERWRRQCGEVREAIETHGYDAERGVFKRAFDDPDLDGALLLLPKGGFIAYDDPRMVRTTDAIREQFGDDGLVQRFPTDIGEGAFLACSFWLAECLHHQGRRAEARQIYDRVLATRNDLGLFSEEYDRDHGTMLGNFPQALTHLAHIAAARTLAEPPSPRWADPMMEAAE